MQNQQKSSVDLKVNTISTDSVEVVTRADENETVSLVSTVFMAEE